jgi:hypothetical protein
MEKFKSVRSETVVVTHDLAAEFSKMPASPTERDFKSKRVDYLKDQVLGGTAITFIWAKAKIADTGETVRMNGLHSSTMLASLNGHLPTDLKAHIDTYEVPTKAALGTLFRQFDSRLSARNVDDIAGSYQGLQPELANVPKAAARKAIEGAIWYEKNKIGNDTPTGDDRFEWFRQPKHHMFIQMVGRILSEKTPEFTIPVIGAMYGAYERSPEGTEEFYDAVAKQGGGNEENHPATVLDQWLVTARQEVEKPKEQEIYHACAFAWNAFRNHKTLDRGIPKYNKKKGAPELD